jgi:hypothetical protein
MCAEASEPNSGEEKMHNLIVTLPEAFSAKKR